MKIPSYPSTIASFPSQSSSYSTPIKAGMFIILARIAVWELVDPFLVTNAKTFVLSSCKVSLGAKSSATKIYGSSVRNELSAFPCNILIRRLEISFTSAARSFIYSSSIDENNSAKLSPVDATAYSAFICSFLII